MSAVKRWNPVEALGAWVLESVEDFGGYVRFTTAAVVGIVKPPYRLRLLFKQMEFVGNQSLSIVMITGAFTGMVFAVQSDFAFGKFGARGLIGSTVVLALCRELGPVLTSLMVNGRVGSAFAAELGTMRVTEQIDALESMAIDPIQYLAAPRIGAALLMMPILCAVFDLVGTVGVSYVATQVLGVNPGPFYNRMEWFVDPDDIWGGMLKSAFFGFVLASVGCYRGYNARGGAEGVGQATTRAVVASGVAILVVDYFITLILAPMSVNRV
ncbi:ABC transporter permease [Deltaproteobacteria bacterium]|nr:ABC transporter permease [Deltaproteobacteria bacterium]